MIAENIVTLLLCAALVLGLAYMGTAFWWAGFFVLLNLNLPRRRRK